MTKIFSFASSSRRRRSLARATLLLALAMPLAVSGQAQQSQSQQERRTPSEKIQPIISQIGPLQQANNFEGMLKVVEDGLKIADRGSFDEHFLSDIRGRLLLMQNKYAEATAAIERAYEIGIKERFYEPSRQQDVTFILAQLYAQQAGAPGLPPAQQDSLLAKSIQYAKQTMDLSPKPPPELLQFYAQVLLGRASTAGDNADPALLNEAERVLREGLYSAIKPRSEFYSFLLFVLMQKGEYAQATHVLELLVRQFPENQQYWQQLSGMYHALGSDEKTRDAPKYLIRAINTLERAQAAGLLNAPRDHLNLVGMYQQAGHLAQAAELLEEGLKNGRIENTQQNWEILADSYQTIDRQLKGIEILREAAQHFPKSGRLDFKVALYYYSMEKIPEAYEAGKVALEKGDLDRPHLAWQYLAFWAYELRKFDEALAAVNKAMEFPESQKDSSLIGLKEAIETSIQERQTQETALRSSQNL